MVGALLHAPQCHSGALPTLHRTMTIDKALLLDETTSLHHLRHHPHIGSVRHSPRSENPTHACFTKAPAHQAAAAHTAPRAITHTHAAVTEDDLYAPLVMRNTPAHLRRRPIMRSSIRLSRGGGSNGLTPLPCSCGNLTPRSAKTRSMHSPEVSAQGIVGVQQTPSPVSRRLRLDSEEGGSSVSTPPASRSSCCSSGSPSPRHTCCGHGSSVSGPILITSLQEQVMISHSLAAIGQRTRSEWAKEQARSAAAAVGSKRRSTRQQDPRPGARAGVLASSVAGMTPPW